MMAEKPKLLWHSNSPWSFTGYGAQTALFYQRLNEHYNFGVSAFYGLLGSAINWGGVPIYPGLEHSHGNEVIQDHARVHFGGDIRSGLVVTLMDVWILNPAVWRRLNVASWVPVDHDPLPPIIGEFFNGSQAVPIAMSRFGEGMLRDAGLDPIYVPHAVDTSAFRPIPKEQARKITKLPQEGFIVGMVAANRGQPSRKCFEEALQAFKAFRDQHPDALLYLHTELSGKFDGVNLPDLMTQVGLSREAVMFADQYRVLHMPFAPETMAAVYSSLDVLLMPSAGEGFGIPAVEAQACGVPVIVSDFSAQPELVGAGWLVSGRRQYTPLKAWQFRPDVEDILAALRSAYSASPGKREEMAAKARAFAEQYDVDHVLNEFMLPALEEARERFVVQEPVRIAPRAKAAA